MFKLIVFAFLIFSSKFAFADQSSKFRASARMIPSILIQKGFTQVGDINMRQLVNQMNQVQVRPAGEDEIAAMNGNGRKTARWEINGASRTIVFNASWINKFSDQKGLLALHEFLGALSFDDEDYMTSAGLWFLSQGHTGRLQPEELRRVLSSIESRARVRYAGNSGGVVGVGGGGEVLSAFSKTFALNRAMQMLMSPENRNHPQRRYVIIDALITLMHTRENVSFTRGANPSLDFSDSDPL
jgi:hypothetical protein